MMRAREDRCALVASALLAALLLLLFSRCSPLYPTNNWGEANAFFTVGRGMLAGKLPYRDFALNAGPLVFALHALAARISPGSFLGVWLLEIAALAAALFIAWRAAVRISGRKALSMGCAALAGLLLVSSRAFVSGDTVEEFALPFQLWALCDLLRFMDDAQGRMSLRRMLLHGVLAGCVFWMKFALCGVHLAFIAVIAVDALARAGGVQRAIKMCCAFAGGLALTLLPWLLYFGANAALSQFFSVYFYRNWKALVENARPLWHALVGLGSGMLRNPAAALMLLCGAMYLLLRLVRRRWRAAHTAVALAFACAAVLAYWDGTRYAYSPMAVAAFLLLSAGPLARLVARLWRWRRAWGAVLALAAALCVGFNGLTNGNLPYIGYPAEELPQQKFAQIMAENGGGSLLTLEIPDSGFYLAAGQLPEHARFADCPAYFVSSVACQGLKSQYDILEHNGVEWVILRRGTAFNGFYKLVAEASSPYDRSVGAQGSPYRYYLFRRAQ